MLMRHIKNLQDVHTWISAMILSFDVFLQIYRRVAHIHYISFN